MNASCMENVMLHTTLPTEQVVSHVYPYLSIFISYILDTIYIICQYEKKNSINRKDIICQYEKISVDRKIVFNIENKNDLQIKSYMQL
jgi:hypothetical protein